MIAPRRYSAVAMALHWAIALALAFQLALGWRMADAPRGGATFAAFQLHKSLGITILVLSLVRLGLRLATPRPAPVADSIWAHRLAGAVHGLLYAVMIGGPLTGWAIVSTARLHVPTLLFGTIPLPNLPLPAALGPLFGNAHSALAWIGVGLFVLHVAGALRHQFGPDRAFLGRMAPVGAAGATLGNGAAFALAAGLIGAVGLAFFGGNGVPVGASPLAAAAAPVAAASIAPDTLSSEPAASASAPASAAASDEASAVPTGAATTDEAAAAQPVAPWQVLPGGKLGFTAQVSGAPVHGSFARWTGAIRFSPDDLDHSAIKVTVDLASATTADTQRDGMLAGDDFFAVATHPSAAFTSHSIRHAGGDNYVVRGDLALKGAERPVTLAFHLTIDGDKARASGTARLDRTSFHIGEGEWANADPIAFPVSIDFSFSARRNPAGR
ncbi:YceI family protein [Novosphingobium lentum]|uniref:YceI family protein n=1 Tax=Novosphingobium lentum TaxID=145287 RepID=UPI00082BD288|nr:YceI family protein [Novosphingobium lentum]